MVMTVFSVLPLSAWAACSHNYVHIYTMENGDMHSYVSQCTACGLITEGWGYAGWENHEFSNSVCTKCKYSKTCAHSSTTTKYTSVSDTQHKIVTHCNSCGVDNNKGTESHSWTNDSCSVESDTKHKRVKVCVCGEKTAESEAHTFVGQTCSGCGYTKAAATAASVTLSASGPSGTLNSAGGEIVSQTYPASYTVTASSSGCSVTKIVYTLNGRTYSVNDSSVTITANTESDFETSTFTAYTDVSGVTATFTVNFKFVSVNIAYYMWETFREATIRSITGNGMNKTLEYTMDLDNSYDYQANLTDEQIETLQGLIGRSDGKTYTIHYTRKIRVYTPGDQTYYGEKIIYGVFDGNNPDEIETCLNTWQWGEDTKAAIRQAASSYLTFTTGLPVDCAAVWIDTSTGQELYSKEFGEGYVWPYQSKIVSVSYSEYADSDKYVYEKLTYSGDTTGSSTSQSYSQTYTATSKPLTVTFYCHPENVTPTVTTGTITVYVRDSETDALISGASVTGAGKSGTTGSAGYVKFTKTELGTYSFTASKSGYADGSGQATITESSSSTKITIYLTPTSPAEEEEEEDYPENGNVTVYVRDASTNALLSSAYVSGGSYGGYTGSSGYVTFRELDYGTYTFSASKSGYYSNSGSATISGYNTDSSITIYLSPIEEEEEDEPITGAVTVYVYDSETGSLISGATVSGTGYTKTTNSAGYAAYTGLSMGSYTFTVSKSGYNSGSGSATISVSDPAKAISIYLTPIPTKGNVTVYVRDMATDAVISGATISGDRSGTTNSSGYITFNDLTFGTYTFTASKEGYNEADKSAIISEDAVSKTITIYLQPLPTTGRITVYVKDMSTDAVIPSATISGDRSGTTNSSGYITFKNLPFGSYTFAASKKGYYEADKPVSISADAPSQSATIYLLPVPTSGRITVYVKDAVSGEAIADAEVSGGGYSGTTNSDGTVSLRSVPFGSYTFQASKYGYKTGRGVAAISTDNISESITIYLEKLEADVGISGKTVDGTVYRGSTIMVSANVFGDVTLDFTPDTPLTVTMQASRNNGTVFDTQTKTVICPKRETNLVWFEVDIPKTGYTSSIITFTFTVTVPDPYTDSYTEDNVSSKTVLAQILSERTSPDAAFELEPPANFTNSVYKNHYVNELSWSVWEWDEGFTKKTYRAKLTVQRELVPDSTAVWVRYNAAKKLWTTRSGYGLNGHVSVYLTGVDKDMFAGSAKVNAYYPEFNYSPTVGKSNMLVKTSENPDGYSAYFTFDKNNNTISGSQMHLTPIWYPDGEYSIKYSVYDLWTPAGMLTSTTYAMVGIEGSIYDDYYTQRD